jgi:hypothetical protein
MARATAMSDARMSAALWGESPGYGAMPADRKWWKMVTMSLTVSS